MPTNWNISKLRERVEAWNQVLERLAPEHRRLVLIAGAGLLVLLFYLAVVGPIISLEDSWGQDIVQRRLLLMKYQSLVDSKDRVVKANAAMKGALTRIESQFLSGANSAVASADLQEILKNLTATEGVKMSSAKVLQPREAGPYLEVPVQVQLSATITQLVSLLYNLEHNKKLLFIPELDINAPQMGQGDKKDKVFLINMVISGVIKKGVSS
jgi:type II secretory pathway component PulM